MSVRLPIKTEHRFFSDKTYDSGVAFAPFTFVCAADPQFGFFQNDASWDEEIALIRRFVHHVNRLAPAFAVVCGDLTNSLVGVTDTDDASIRRRQVDDFRREMGAIDENIPVLCLCGNHDVGNRPTQRLIDVYKSDFGDDYFEFWHQNVCCLAANSNFWNDPSGAPALHEAQMAWLEERMAFARDAGATHIFLFTHHPMFLLRHDEPDESDEFGFTSFSGDKLNNSYFHIPTAQRKPVLDLCLRYGVSHIFSGHWHRCAVAESGGIRQIITSAIGRQLGDDDSGCRLVHVTESGVDVPYKSFDTLDKEEAEEKQ